MTTKPILLQLNNALRQLLRRTEVDRAVLFGILTRIWGIAAGPVTAILIATKFSPELQGYYFTFASLLALQVFVELGLGTVIIQFASHEWSKLGINNAGQIVGDGIALSRLVSLAGIASKWYLAGSVIITLGLGIGGYFFFSQGPDSTVNWVAPWLMLCLLTGITICLVPIWSLLEGCNQVANVYTYRFIQGLCMSLSVWLAILLGADLWTASVSSVVGLLCAGILLGRRYWKFLKTLLFSRQIGPRIGWRLEILPMQWRIALSWLSGYFIFSLFTPILFHYHGPVIAGQMGMTWSLVMAVSGVSSAWVAPKAPRFGMLIARREYKELDRLFWRLIIIISIVAGLGAAASWTLVYILNVLGHPLATRLLPPLPTGLFMLATFIMTTLLPFSVYLRAHKKEPLLFISVMGAILVSISNLILGKYFGATGMATGYLAVNIVLIPFIVLVWYRCRAMWHGPVGRERVDGNITET
ncbi:MAG: hypothetical protein DDT30_01901 [Dehalococcoidia bacterium]|nr:hypothetical protein [Bacillota bacterium]